jgi:hypothetical protein
MKFANFALLAVAGAVVDARHLKGKKSAEEDDKMGKKEKKGKKGNQRAIQANEDYQKHYLVRLESV